MSGSGLRVGPRGIDAASIAGVVGGEWIVPPGPGVAVSGATIDTRTARPGQVFFALRGERADGHDFLGDAARSGCGLALVDRPVEVAPGSMAVLRVGETLAAMGRLAWAYRRSVPGLGVVCVTGSNGKTTTVRMIHGSLRAGGLRGSCSEKSHNNGIGVPLTLLNAGFGDGYVVCEVGTNRPGEIAQLAALCAPDVSVITSIGMSHLEALGSVEGVAREKAEVVRALGPAGVAFVADGSPALDSALAGSGVEIVRVGTGAGCGVRVERIESAGGGASCFVDGEKVRSRLPGGHNARNAALAFSVARRLGVSASDAARGILEAEPPPMRMERVVVRSAGGLVEVVNDAYNANPDSMRAAIGLLCGGEFDPPGSVPARRVAVIGEMLELGASGGAAHAEVARQLAACGGVSGVVLIGSRAAEMAREIELSRPGLVWLAEADPGSDWPASVAGLLREGDLALLKGSRGVRLERLIGSMASSALGAVSR